MTSPNIRELQVQAHKTALEHGWWENPRTLSECLMLASGELAEAAEEYRKGILPNVIYCKTCYPGSATGPMRCPHASSKPEGLPVELADVVIRLMDALEYEGVSLPTQAYTLPPTSTSIMEQLWSVNVLLVTMGTGPERAIGVYAETAMGTLQGIAEANGFDLWEAVRLKMAYNETRPYRHGGKKA